MPRSQSRKHRRSRKRGGWGMPAWLTRARYYIPSFRRPQTASKPDHRPSIPQPPNNEGFFTRKFNRFKSFFSRRNSPSHHKHQKEIDAINSKIEAEKIEKEKIEKEKIEKEEKKFKEKVEVEFEDIFDGLYDLYHDLEDYPPDHAIERKRFYGKEAKRKFVYLRKRLYKKYLHLPLLSKVPAEIEQGFNEDFDKVFDKYLDVLYQQNVPLSKIHETYELNKNEFMKLIETVRADLQTK